MLELPTKGMRYKVFASTTACRDWAGRTFDVRRDYGGELGHYEVRCANAARFERDGSTNIRVTYDSDGHIDRFQVIDSRTGTVVAEP